MTFIRKEKGFTLIELMVVVAILAILAIVAIPRILAALDDARRSEARATATSIANALSRYYIENEEYPAEAYTGDDIESANVLTILDWSGAASDPELREYLDLRNAESITLITRDTIEAAAAPHDWEITITFADARPQGAATDVRMVAVITPEHIVWEDTSTE